MFNIKLHSINIIYSRLSKWIISLSLICIPVLGTLSDYGVTFDEPIYMEAAWNIQKWLSLDQQKSFTQAEIDRHWRVDLERNVHPSGVKWLYLTAQKIIFWEKDPYTQNRVLNILIFSISILLFLSWWAGDSLVRYISFIVLLLTIPRFFAHTHFAATDIPMTSLLLLFVVCLDKTLFLKSFWLAGIILGIGASIKITSSILAMPLLLVFLIWYRYKWKAILPRVALICLTAVLVFYILNPDWWFSPLSRYREFMTQTLTRRTWTPFTLYFGGDFYTYRAPLCYPFAIFFITTPLLHMLLLFLGLGYFFAEGGLRTNLKMILLFILLVFPFLILALSISPAHDGIRYLLPAFPFAVCFMTLGLEKLWRFLRECDSTSSLRKAARWITAAFALALIAGDLHNPAWYPPFELSYYNRIVGGLSGANHHGYETTYWMEILNDDVLKQLNKLCTRASVYFPISPTDHFFSHMLNNRKIEFIPEPDHSKANFMFIIGRPYVRFWESKMLPKYEQEGKISVPVWDISLDTVPLFRLYMIQKDKHAM